MLKKLPNFPSRKNNQFKMRDIQFVKNQFVSRIPKSLQTCFLASLEKAFSNPLGTGVVLEQITENAASVTFIYLKSEVGIKIPQKDYGSIDGPEYFAFYEIKRILTKKI